MPHAEVKKFLLYDWRMSPLFSFTWEAYQPDVNSQALHLPCPLDQLLLLLPLAAWSWRWGGLFLAARGGTVGCSLAVSYKPLATPHT